MKGENTLYGEFALKTPDNMRVKKAIIFPSSISLKCGIMGSLLNNYALFLNSRRGI